MKHINFMGQRRLAIIMSAVLLLISLGSLMVNQLEWGLDFTGGTLVEVEYGDSADLDAIRSTLETRGYPGAQVVSFGTDRDVLIRLPADLDADGSDVLQVLRSSTSDSVELRRTEFVGPQVGDELREQGGLAMLLALGLVMLYIGFRFQLKFAVGAVAALVHDVILTLGFFSVLRLDFDLTVLAALLAVIGYSLNDTIVVFDRIRENMASGVSKMSFEDRVNASINQCLGRTIITSVTTFLVVLTVFITFFGSGDVIADFALALLVGVMAGTYSSVFIASPLLVLWNKKWPIK